MARPITWQDVAAPNQAGNLAAAQAAGNQITQALSGLGNTGTAWRDAERLEATKQAVASVAASADPLAAAAATPQDWRIDPLAVQQAATAQDNQLRQAKVVESTLASNALQQEAAGLQIEDTKNKRLAAELANPLFAEVEKTGLMPHIDPNDDRWIGPAGLIAQDNLRAYVSEVNRNKQATADFNLRRQKMQEDKSVNDAIGELTSFGLTPEAILADPATHAKKVQSVFKKHGTSMAFLPQGLAALQQGLTSNAPTSEQLSNPAAARGAPVKGYDQSGQPINLTYGNVVSQVKQAAANLEAKKAEQLAEFNGTFAATDLITPSKYAGLDEATLKLQLAKELDADPDDIGQQITAFKAAAKDKDKVGITNEQAAMLVVRARGDEGFFGTFADTAVPGTDAAQAGIEQLIKFNKNGGVAGLTRKMGEATADTDKQLAIVNRALLKVGAVAQNGGELPKEALDITEAFRKAFEKEQEDEVKRGPPVTNTDLLFEPSFMRGG